MTRLIDIGGATGEDDFPLFARIEEMLQLAAGSLVFSRGGFRQVVHATVDVGMLSSLIMHQAIDHLLRHLAGCRIVEIDQRISLDLKFEYRKIRANAFDVERRTEPGLQGGLYNIHCSVSLSLLQNDSLKPMFERSHGYAIDDLGAECVGQQIARREFG